eukprot:CAMPEP_0177658378 /NCGR_PEP_ID=MMETSP0447-20121125/16769_1 /TAXON_ID=0 /ORGANISM="Stygamoeba regulata, Strain BSH-02190019" /LENGTH=205 /DNA_ID=CAMNT_0019162961 /DNA_START=99 /DNA_END=716 /DNA_ORIENTATION=-
MTADTCVTPSCYSPLMENRRGDGELKCASCDLCYSRDETGKPSPKSPPEIPTASEPKSPAQTDQKGCTASNKVPDQREGEQTIVYESEPMSTEPSSWSEVTRDEAHLPASAPSSSSSSSSPVQKMPPQVDELLLSPVSVEDRRSTVHHAQHVLYMRLIQITRNIAAFDDIAVIQRLSATITELSNALLSLEKLDQLIATYSQSES